VISNLTLDSKGRNRSMKILREAKRFLNRKATKAKLSNILTISHKNTSNLQTSMVKTAQGTSFLSNSRGPSRSPVRPYKFNQQTTGNNFQRYSTQSNIVNTVNVSRKNVDLTRKRRVLQNEMQGERVESRILDSSFSSQRDKKGYMFDANNQKFSSEYGSIQYMGSDAGQSQEANMNGRATFPNQREMDHNRKTFTSEILTRTNYRYSPQNKRNKQFSESKVQQYGSMKRSRVVTAKSHKASPIGGSRVTTVIVKKKEMTMGHRTPQFSPGRNNLEMSFDTREESEQSRTAALRSHLPKIRLGCNYLKIMFQKQQQLTFHLIKQVKSQFPHNIFFSIKFLKSVLTLKIGTFVQTN